MTCDSVYENIYKRRHVRPLTSLHSLQKFKPFSKQVFLDCMLINRRYTVIICNCILLFTCKEKLYVFVVCEYLNAFLKGKPPDPEKPKLISLMQAVESPRGGGGSSNISSYVGLDPASTVYQNTRNIRHAHKKYLKFY